MTPTREPALYIAATSAGLSLLVAFGVGGLTSNQAGLVIAAITAVGAAVTALFTRPVAPAVFTGAFAAVFALLAGFHFNVSPETVAAFNTAALAVLTLLFRGQVSPASGPGGRH